MITPVRFSEMIEGLQILAKYEEKGLESHINGADHDVIWASTAEVEELDEEVEELDEEVEEPVVDEDGEPILTDTRISAEDAKRLEELGWFIDDAAESWTHYC